MLRIPVVHVVDDDASFRHAMVRVLVGVGFEAREYGSAESFLATPPRAGPGCILLDVSMPGVSGIELQLALNKRPPALPIVFLTGNGDIPMSVVAIRAGAVDFLTKPVERQVLLAAIAAALKSQYDARKMQRDEQEMRRRFSSLSSREQYVFNQIVDGNLSKKIAGDLGTCERTIKAHRSHIMEKLEVRSVAGLVFASIQLGTDLRRLEPIERKPISRLAR